MIITDIEAILLKGNQSYGSLNSSNQVLDQGDWQLLVKVTTDEGLVGWSDVETLAPAAKAIIAGQSMGVIGFKTLREMIIGENPLDIEKLWDRLYIGSVYYGRRGIALQCISAIDNCLWSIKAQAEGLALCELLGTTKRHEVLAYASTLFRDTPEDNVLAVKEYISKGFRAVKFGWGVFGEDVVKDVEILSAIREEVGPEFHLMIDPGWYGAGWKKRSFQIRSLEENLSLCERLEPFKPEWVEDFIHPEKLEDYAYVRRQSSLDIAAGEQISTEWDFERYINLGCVDVIQPDLTRCGGLTVAKKIIKMANEAGIDLVPHSWLTDLLHAYSLHLIAVLPKGRFVEFNVSQSKLTQGVCGGIIKLNKNGTLTIPRSKGIGVEVDESFVDAHRVT